MQARRQYFDLVADPGEQQDVATAHVERVRSLAAELDQLVLASLEGFHLFAVAQADHDVDVVLESDAGFADASPLEAEDGDRASIAPDGHTLTVALRLRPHESPVRAHDLDAVRFHTRDGATVTLRSVTLDGQPAPASTVLLGKSPASLLPDPGAAIPHERLRVLHPVRPKARERGVAVSLQLVEPRPPAATELAPDVVERLRALGYVP
jgi:hypothetical protein